MQTKPLIAATLISTMLFGNAFAGGGHSSNSQTRSSTDLSSTEISNLEFMREEEKLARDAYLTLDVYWGRRPRFLPISQNRSSNTPAALIISLTDTTLKIPSYMMK